MPLTVQHARIDREEAAQFQGASGLAFGSREPMKDDPAPPRRQMCLDEIKHGLRRSNAVDRDDLVPRLRATLQHMLENSLLRVE